MRNFWVLKGIVGNDIRWQQSKKMYIGSRSGELKKIDLKSNDFAKGRRVVGNICIFKNSGGV